MRKPFQIFLVAFATIFSALIFAESAHSHGGHCGRYMTKIFHCDNPSAASANDSRDEAKFRRWCNRPGAEPQRARNKEEYCAVSSHAVHQRHVCEKYEQNNCREVLGKTDPKGKFDCKGKGARGCQNSAREQQQKAQRDLAQKKNDLQSAITDAGQLANKALMDAAEFLTNWSDKAAAEYPNDATENQALRHDDSLLRRAIQSHDDKNVKFTEDDADTAKSQNMAELLKFAVVARDVKSLEEESLAEVNSAQIALQKIESQTALRADNLGTVGYPEGNKGGLPSSSGISGTSPTGMMGSNGAKGLDGGPSGKSDITGAGDKLDSGDGQTLKIAGGRSLASAGGRFGGGSAGTGEEGASQAEDAGQNPRFKAGGLRDLLRTRMGKGSPDEKEEKNLKDKDAIDGATFGKGIGGLYAEEKLNQEGADRSGAKPGFAMGLDTKGNATSFFDDVIPTEMGDEEARDEIESGVLGLDSKNLFQRVHEAHKTCQRRHCL